MFEDAKITIKNLVCYDPASLKLAGSGSSNAKAVQEDKEYLQGITLEERLSESEPGFSEKKMPSANISFSTSPAISEGSSLKYSKSWTRRFPIARICIFPMSWKASRM